MARPDGRSPSQLRPLELQRAANPHAEGSCLVRMGGTLVLCTASVEEDVPPWRRASGLGWLTAEYAMLPRATSQRTPRERNGPGGRTHEIQRLIGRSVRAALKGFDFGPRTIRVDCDVLQADGGTRTASVTGATVALADACRWIEKQHGIASPFGRLVAAVSVGVIKGETRLDLAYEEDRDADVDANVVMAEPDQYVEVQGTGERDTFARAGLTELLDMAARGLKEIFAAQRRVLAQ